MAEKKGIKAFTPTWSLRLVLIDIPVLIIALILDVLGIVTFFLSLFVVGIPLSYILDAVGIVVIGFWLIFFRSGKLPITKRIIRLFKRAGLPILGELIPFFGDVVFCWTIYVLYEIISQDELIDG